MSNQPNIHPQKEELIAFGHGKLTPQAATQVESHLESCPLCCETIHNLQDDTFVALVRKAPAPAPSLDSDRSGQPPAADDRTDRVAVQATIDLQSGVTSPGSEAAELPRELREHPRYEILKLIGRGGMGDVYKAQHKLMNRPVALKVIKPQLVKNEAAVQRFHREVQAAARLHHPNIVTSYDAEQTGNFHYLVMEFVDGVNLHEVVRKRGMLPVAEACEYIRQTAEGLQRAHELGMVHRDIKPHNLMVVKGRETRDKSQEQEGHRDSSGSGLSTLDSGLYVKILDFGLASLTAEAVEEKLADAAAGDAEEPSLLTLAGTMLGTPDYIAPEQARDAHTADIRADIYSLGCTFFTLLAGRPPFGEGSVLDKIKAHTEKDAPPLSDFRDDVPAEVEAILRKMMAKDPAERYQTPADVAEGLRVAASFQLAESAAKNRQAGSLSPRPQRAWRPVVLLTAAATLLVALAAAIVFYIQTDYGVVRVEVADESLQVKLNGRTIEMKDGQTPLSIRAGESKLVVRRGDFEFETESFQLRRGDEVAVKVELVSGEVVVVKDGERFGAKTLPESAWPQERAVEPDNLTPARIDLVRTLEEHSDVIQDLEVTRDGRLLISAGAGEIIVRDAETLDLLHKMQTERDGTAAIAASPDGKLLATGGQRDWLEIWDLSTGERNSRQPGIRHDRIAYMQWAPDGNSLGVKTKSSAWVEIDLTAGKVARGLPTNGTTNIYSSDGRWIAHGDPRNFTVTILNADTGEVHRRLTMTSGRVRVLDFSDDIAWLLVGGETDARVWDVESGSLVVHLPGESAVHAGAFLPNRHQVITGHRDARQMKVWDFEGLRVGRVVAIAENVDVTEAGFAVLPNGYIATAATKTLSSSEPGFATLPGSDDDSEAARDDGAPGRIQIWRLPESVWPSNAPDKPVVVALTEAGRYTIDNRPVDDAVELMNRLKAILEGNPDCEFVVESAEQFGNEPVKQLVALIRELGAKRVRWLAWAKPGDKLNVVRFLEGHAQAISDLTWHPDGRRAVAISGADGHVRMWDTDSGTTLWTADVASDQNGVGGVAVSPEGKMVAVGDATGLIRVLDADTGKEIKRWQGHEHGVAALEFSPSGDWLAAVSTVKGPAKVWDVASGNEIPPRDDAPDAYDLAFTNDGWFLFTGGGTFYSRRIEADSMGTKRFGASWSGGSVTVHSVASTADGMLVAYGQSDGTIVLRQRSGRLENGSLGYFSVANGTTEPVHQGPVTSLAFTPDGRYLISGGMPDARLRPELAYSSLVIWDCDLSKQQPTAKRVFEQHSSSNVLARIALSPDGRTLRIADGGATDRDFRIHVCRLPESVQPLDRSVIDGLQRDAVLMMNFDKSTFYEMDGQSWVRDVSGNANDARCEQARLSVDEFSRNSILIDPKGNLQVPRRLIASGKPFSVTAWVHRKLSWDQGDPLVFAQSSKDGASELSCGLGIVDGQWMLNFVSGDAYIHHPFGKDADPHRSFARLGNWAFFAWTRDAAGKLSFTVDGITQPTQHSDLGAGEEDSHELVEFGRGLDGGLDEVAVFNRALSSAELQQLHTWGKIGRVLPEPAEIDVDEISLERKFGGRW